MTTPNRNVIFTLQIGPNVLIDLFIIECYLYANSKIIRISCIGRIMSVGMTETSYPDIIDGV